VPVPDGVEGQIQAARDLPDLHRAVRHDGERSAQHPRARGEFVLGIVLDLQG
jgi:hypothetical protein